jgi:hypothetical protein
MARLKIAKSFAVMIALVLLTQVAAEAQHKPARGAKHTAGKIKVTDATIVISNCEVNYTSVEAVKTVTFTVDPSDTRTYYILMDHPEAFSNGVQVQKIDANNPGKKLNAHSGANQITTLWWADATVACSASDRAKAKANPKMKFTAPGDPNDITVP